jgi:hypothetical protein
VRLTKRTRLLLGLTSAEPLRGEPKTARSRRVVEMAALAVEPLRQRRQDCRVISLNGLTFIRPDGRTLAYRPWTSVGAGS